MLIFYAAAAVAVTFVVFRSPALDYRLVALGAVLPVLEAPFRAGPLHALLAPTAVLVVVMLATRNRRLVRRQWLGLPIGMYLHLALDVVAGGAATFWWPFLGGSLGSVSAPEAARGWWGILLELVGIALLAWEWRRFGLDDEARRSRFWKTGQLDRAVIGPEGTGS